MNGIMEDEFVIMIKGIQTIVQAKQKLPNNKVKDAIL